MIRVQSEEERWEPLTDQVEDLSVNTDLYTRLTSEVTVIGRDLGSCKDCLDELVGQLTRLKKLKPYSTAGKLLTWFVHI